MFIDLVTIKVQAGNGGQGLVSFRREKYVNRGGPDGGSGGHGGNVIFEASDNEYDLTKFRLTKLIKASDGQPGGKNNRSGKSGQDMVVSLPRGTLVKDAESHQIVVDLVGVRQSFVAAQGGEGGFGNAHFKSSLQRTPLVAERGLKGEVKSLTCELRLLAEVGLVGLPNAGKSTFLQAVTRARPKIAAYPFTTLEPHLGVSQNGLRIADIPGLIEGAAEGKGLGHQFLRHIERTLVILHLIDCQDEDPLASYQQIQSELEAYNPNLLKRPQLLVLTKIDTVEAQTLKEITRRLQRQLARHLKVYEISALTNANLKPLLKDLRYAVEDEKRRRQTADDGQEDAGLVIFSLEPTEAVFKVEKLPSGTFLISGSKIETFALKTDFDNYHARQRLADIMMKMGIIRQLLLAGYESEAIVFGAAETGPLYLNEDYEQQLPNQDSSSRAKGSSR